MKISLNKFLLIILVILNVSCESESNIIDPPLTISSECNDGESLGCDGICPSPPQTPQASFSEGEDEQIPSHPRLSPSLHSELIVSGESIILLSDSQLIFNINRIIKRNLL
jgi:hypothetical protein